MKTIKNFEYSFMHVKKRLYERHNIIIDILFYNKMNEHIRKYLGSPDYGTDNNGDQEIHSMFIIKKYMKVVYSLSKDRITTVL